MFFRVNDIIWLIKIYFIIIKKLEIQDSQNIFHDTNALILMLP